MVSAIAQPIPRGQIAADNELLQVARYDSWNLFRNEEVLWFRVTKDTFDNFMAHQPAANKL